jgi:putative phosphoribosyl transferase
MIFKNRIDAAQKLAELIEKNDLHEAIVLGLPRGGVIVAKEIARKLNLTMDIVVTRKIGAPFNEEYAIGAVSEHELIMSNNEYSEQYAQKEILIQREEIKRRTNIYRGDKKLPILKNRTVILADDGLATGLTMLVAVKEVKIYKPQKIIIAVPVAPPETVEKLKSEVDEIIVLNIEPMFFAVGQFYEEFNQVSDDEVMRLLR